MRLFMRMFLALFMVISAGHVIAAPTSLFDGKSFSGWEGPKEFFRIESGAIVGGSLERRIPKNQFLATTRAYANFDLRLQFKVIGKDINAGVQVRSRRISSHHEMIGYQVDIGQHYWGSLYDESRRRRILAQANLAEVLEVVDLEGWNMYRIRCEGRRVRAWINGYQTIDYTEPDASIEQDGFIGLQIHSGPPTEVWYKDIVIEELSAPSSSLAAGVRGVATRAPGRVVIDGDLSEFGEAFSTPLEYFHSKLRERAAQFFYMWDEEAFYAGLRTLDSSPANHAPDDRLWQGDGVEWYFDTRRGADFRSRTWTDGAVHCYWVGLTGEEMKSRFCLRPGYLDAIPKIGVEVASRRTAVGVDVEFKLPWANFPEFKAAIGQVIAVDAELCYSDGGPRVDRGFVFGSPLSVQQPASLGRIQLVEKFRPEYWAACGAVMAPLRCDTAWKQDTKPHVTAYMALPPNRHDDVSRVLFRVVDTRGSTLGEYPAKVEVFEAVGEFRRAVARWPADLSLPGTYNLVGILYDQSGAELARVTPRMVSVGMQAGY